MFTPRTKAALMIGLGAVSFAVGAYATDAEQAEPVAAAAAPESEVERPQYGPILVDDPETVEAIKALYDGEREAIAELEAELDGIRAELATVEDFEARMEKQREAGDLRQRMFRARVEYGLDIARLNEDPRRIADFEQALDFLNHPERYRPEPVHVDRGN